MDNRMPMALEMVEHVQRDLLSGELRKHARLSHGSGKKPEQPTPSSDSIRAHMEPARVRSSIQFFFMSTLAAGLAAGVAAHARPGEVKSGARLASARVAAKVIAAPGRIFDPGVVIVRGGIIEAVGAEGKVAVPPDARVFNLKGKVVYAAFIDPYVSVDRLQGKRPKAPLDEEEPPAEAMQRPPARPQGPSAHPHANVRAHERTVDTVAVKERVLDTYERLGFAVVAAVPETGTLRGRGAVLSLGDSPIGGRVIKEEFGHYVSLEPERFDFSSPDVERALTRAQYPSSKMGAVALARQAFLDALWARDAEATYAKHPAGQARPKVLAADLALRSAVEAREPVVFETTDVLALLRAT